MEKGEWRFLLILSHGDGGGYSVITLLSYSRVRRAVLVDHFNKRMV